LTVLVATDADVSGFLCLAGEVEHWFGPMVDDPTFHTALDGNVSRGTAFVVRGPAGLLGGLLTGGRAPRYHLGWLVVSKDFRGQGVGRALVQHALGGFARPCRVDVVTFGADHPASVGGGARMFYQQLGFRQGQTAPRGPEGGSRQWYHLALMAAAPPVSPAERGTAGQ
jgi:GNAT superfamily N-acetyltransferase